MSSNSPIEQLNLAEGELAFCSSPQAPQFLRTGHPFGPEGDVAADAPPIDRLVAFLGRQP